MQGWQQWLTASSISWRGLRWGAAALSFAAHGAAASFAWVMIEAKPATEPATEPARVIEAFTVELVSVDQQQGAVRKKKTVSDSIAVHKAELESKKDLVRAVTSSPAKPIEPLPQSIEKPKMLPRFEIEVASSTPVLESTQQRELPKAVTPKISFPLPPTKPKPVKKPIDQTIAKQVPNKQPKKQQLTVPPTQIASLPSQGGTGADNSPSKGEAVPLTAASYSIGTLGNKPPEYPERARRNEFEGRVLLRVKVSPSGKSETVTVKTSSGYDILDEAAQAAVKAWRFMPAKRAGVAITATIDVPIVFRLTNNP